ncbi:dihydrofolate reductase family protein [Rhodovulum sp. DZ06]|uniref:dihydrofolate reductase family protein n=1 Tax=Rhodovulum sp. DZ06 TaxID=3425126 RepID=UPI003D32F007
MPRPRITCHMITSLDGRLLTERWGRPPEEILGVYEEAEARLDAQGWIVGRVSMAELVGEGAPNIEAGAEGSPRADVIAAPGAGRVAVAFDRDGRLDPQENTCHGDHLVLVVSTRVAQAHVDRLAARGVSVIFAGKAGDEIEDALSRIAAGFGVDHLLLCGGGVMNAAFLEAGLVDETSTILFPVLDGARRIPAIYDGADSSAAAAALELLSVDTLTGGAAWLRHKVLRG